MYLKCEQMTLMVASLNCDLNDETSKRCPSRTIELQCPLKKNITTFRVRAIWCIAHLVENNGYISSMRSGSKSRCFLYTSRRNPFKTDMLVLSESQQITKAWMGTCKRNVSKALGARRTNLSGCLSWTWKLNFYKITCHSHYGPMILWFLRCSG